MIIYDIWVRLSRNVIFKFIVKCKIKIFETYLETNIIVLSLFHFYIEIYYIICCLKNRFYEVTGD